MAVALIALMAVSVLALPAEARTRITTQEGSSLTALRGAVVWARYTDGRTLLYRRSGGHSERLRGVRPLINYTLDLGLDRRGRVVAVYHRCDFDGACSGPYIVDLRSGRERRLRLPRRRGCSTSKGSASIWNGELAYTRSCRGGGSGVFLVRGNGRPRRLVRLSARAAKFAGVDVVPGWVATAGGLYSTHEACRATLPAPPEGFEFGPWSVTPVGEVWWVEEAIGEFGGAETVLKHARLGAGCSFTPVGDPASLNRYNDDTLFPGISVDAGRLYFGGRTVRLSDLRPAAPSS